MQEGNRSRGGQDAGSRCRPARQTTALEIEHQKYDEHDEYDGHKYDEYSDGPTNGNAYKNGDGSKKNEESPNLHVKESGHVVKYIVIEVAGQKHSDNEFYKYGYLGPAGYQAFDQHCDLISD